MKKSNNYGITLVALVVTIAILLILAGVTLQILFNNGNILQIANNAVEGSKKAQIEEKFNIEIANYRAEKIINPELTIEDFWKKLVQAGIINSPADITKVVVEANDKNIQSVLLAKLATTTTAKLAARSTEQTVANQKETYTITTKDGYVATVETDGDNIVLKEVLTPTQAKAMVNTQNPNLITGTIKVSAPSWNEETHTATVTLSNTKGLKMQWQKNSISGIWQTGVAVTGLNHGDTVFTRLIDGEGNAADEASVSILDSISPELATIANLPTSTTTKANITANVTHADNQSKIDITKCKWLFNTTSTNLNVNNTAWNTAHTFSNSTNQISITVPSNPGNYYLHVLSVDIAGNKREKISNKVEVKQLATGIMVNPTSATLYMGNTLTITPTVTPNNTSNKTVTWTSSNYNIATVTTSGVVTPKTPGTVTITAKTTDGTNKTATCSIEVKQRATGITVNPTSATLFMGNTLTITPTVTPTTTTDKTVTWTSSNPSVATVSSNGIVTPVKRGTVTITAKTTDGSNKTATCNIVVDPVAKINQTYYATLQSAVNAVPTTNALTTIELLKDIGEEIKIIENKKIAFKLNNYTMSGERTTISNKGNISITGGTVTATTEKSIENYGIVEISGNTNITSSANAWTTIENQIGATLRIIGGTITSNNSRVIQNYGTTEISGTTNITSAADKVQLLANDGSKAILRITGGTINSNDCMAITNGGTIEISGGTINTNNYMGINNGGIIEISGTANIVSSSNEWDTIRNQSGGILRIRGGTIKNTRGFYSIYNANGTVEITGGTIIGTKYGC